MCLSSAAADRTYEASVFEAAKLTGLRQNTGDECPVNVCGRKERVE